MAEATLAVGQDTEAPLTKEQEKNRKIGREISFGIQQTLACWATDVIDPPVSKFLQNRFGDKSKGPATDFHVWGAEFGGDSLAFFAFMFIKRAFGGTVDSVINRVEKFNDKSYTKEAERAISLWAQENHIAKDDPRYAKKLAEMKHFQAENVVDSSIVATWATILNVAIQKILGNKQSYGVILGSKVVGAVATMSVMLGLRKAMPLTMESMDNELSDRHFSKVADWIKRTFGVADAGQGTIETHKLDNPESHYSKERPRDPAAEALVSTGLAAGLGGVFHLAISSQLEKLPNPAEGTVAAEAAEVGKAVGGVGGAMLAGLGLVTGMWLVMPDTMRRMTQELSERYFSKNLKGIKRFFGMKEDKAPVQAQGLFSDLTMPNQMHSILQNAPLMDIELPEERQALLAKMVAQHARGVNLNDPQAAARFVAEEKNLLDVMINAWAPGGALVKKLADEHHAALERVGSQYTQEDLFSGARGLSALTSLESVQSIAINRRDDMAALKKLLDTPEYMARVKAIDPNAPASTEISQAKREFLIESLLQTRNHAAGRAEPMVHIYANAKGQQVEHKALAQIFDPNGPAAELFAQTLQTSLSHVPAAKLEQVAKDYMADRQNGANKAVDAFKLDGSLVREALDRSEAIRQKRFAPMSVSGGAMMAAA